jgi:hypothetical protein
MSQQRRIRHNQTSTRSRAIHRRSKASGMAALGVGVINPVRPGARGSTTEIRLLHNITYDLCCLHGRTSRDFKWIAYEAISIKSKSDVNWWFPSFDEEADTMTHPEQLALEIRAEGSDALAADPRVCGDGQCMPRNCNSDDCLCFRGVCNRVFSPR